MKEINNILLVRAGVSHRNKIGHPLHCPPPLFLKYVQADLLRQKNYNIHIIDFWVNSVSLADFLKIIDQLSAELVVISIDSPASEAGMRLCRTIKKHRDILIVAVGSDVTERYQVYLDLNDIFDVIIRGEYELEVGVLMQQLNAVDDIGHIKEYYRNHRSKDRVLVDNLDDLPSLEWNKQELEMYPYIYPLRLGRRILSGYVSTSRGCPHACTFCSPTVRKSYGRKLRLRTAVRVVDDMERLGKLGVNVISFEDDDFTLSKEHILSVCKEIQKRRLNIKWTCHARVDEVTPELLKIMKAAGCALLLFGIESGSYKIINTLHKLSSKVNWREKAKYACQAARKIGIATCAMFIVGSPEESEQDVEDSIQLAYAMRPDLIKVHFFTLYPGSTDYERYRNEEKSSHHYLKPIVNLSHMEDAELKKVQLKFYKKFLFRFAFILSHIYYYLPFYLSNWPRSWKLVKEGLLFLLFTERVQQVESNKLVYVVK